MNSAQSLHPHREALRSYYLTGQPIPDWPLAARIARPTPAGYPLCATDSVRPLFSVVKDIVERDGASFPTLSLHLTALADCLNGPPDSWAAPFATRAGLPADAMPQITAELTRVGRRLPKDARIIPLSDSVFCDFTLARLATSRRAAQARLIAEVTTARDRALEVLQPAQAEEETFGADASRFLDINRLAALPRSAGRQGLAAPRRLRLSEALGTLEDFVSSANLWPALWSLDLLAAFDRADGLLRQLSGVLRAMRVVQLECDGTYDEARHPAQIARLQAAPADLLSAPPIIATVAASGFEKLAIGAWTRFLRAQLPVTVLLHAADPTTFDLPLLRLAFGQALVGQTALSHVAHMLDTVDQITAASGPVVILYSRDAWAPLFRHSPTSGLEVHQHATAPVPPSDAPVIPPSAWEDEAAIPFVAFSAADGTPQRAALTANAAAAYRRLDAWKEELATPSEPPPPPSDELLTQARQEGATTAVLRVVEYLTGVLPSSEVGQASTPAGGLQTAPTPVPVHVATTQPSAPTPAPTPAEPESPSADPYIDSFLCTSCNDCMKVNARLFLYDGNKQAYLGPLDHGTFADLVKAAEGCPAKCIHPGSPRPGDASATPAVLARAAKLK